MTKTPISQKGVSCSETKNRGPERLSEAKLLGAGPGLQYAVGPQVRGGAAGMRWGRLLLSSLYTIYTMYKYIYIYIYDIYIRIQYMIYIYIYIIRIYDIGSYILNIYIYIYIAHCLLPVAYCQAQLMKPGSLLGVVSWEPRGCEPLQRQ